MNPSIVLPSAYLMVILTTSNVMVIIACIQAHRALSGNSAQVLGVLHLYQELSWVRHAVNFSYESLMAVPRIRQIQGLVPTKREVSRDPQGRGALAVPASDRTRTERGPAGGVITRYLNMLAAAASAKKHHAFPL
jgi:hypothetical protein